MATQTIQIHPDHQRKLERIAADEHCSPDLIVHDVLENYIRLMTVRLEWSPDLPAEEDKQFTERATAALDHYHTTGLHVTHEEVLEWFGRLRHDAKAAPPACHT